MDIRPWRSVLYVPASKARAVEKARQLAVDAVILDLEDSLAPEAKVPAREALGEVLAADFGLRARLVRINGFDTQWGDDDLSTVAGLGADAVLLPKVGSAAMVEAAAKVLDAAGSNAAIWAMIETPAGVLNAAQIAGAPRMGGFVLGTNDLASDLKCGAQSDRMPMMASLQLCLLAARAAGIVCVDGVYNAFRDVEGLRAECLQGRELGMDGKTVIHPAQIDVANEIFAPSPDEVSRAEAQIEAFRAAQAEGQGIAVLDGKIIENMHVANAEVTLARAAAIRQMQAA
jgi:(3S)-malyl-CoA thioesterase